ESQMLLSLFLLGDLGLNADHPGGPAGGIPLDDLPAIENPDPMAVLVAHPELGFDDRAQALFMGLAAFDRPLAVIGVDQSEPGIAVAADLILGVAQHLFPDAGIVAATRNEIGPHAKPSAFQRKAPAGLVFPFSIRIRVHLKAALPAQFT